MFETLSDTVRSTLRAVRRSKREDLIRHYSFPSGLPGKVVTRLGLSNDDSVARVLQGLKEYFLLCLDGRDMALGMPSKAVDAAWHEFILYTREYSDLCQRVYGRYLHHMPNDAPPEGRDAGRAWMDLGRTWVLNSMRSGQDPRRPSEIPLLFAIDAELGIADGRTFTLDDLAALPIPPGFIETEPGIYRFIGGGKRRKKRHLPGDLDPSDSLPDGETSAESSNLQESVGSGGCSGGGDGD